MSIHKDMKTYTNTPILNIKQVAQIYGASETTVREWAKSGELPGYKVGKRWFFNKGILLGNYQGIEDAMAVLGGNAEKSKTTLYDVLIKDKNLEVRVEVKTSMLNTSGIGKFWRFTRLHDPKNSDYHLLLGYDSSRTSLLHAYFIPTKELEKYIPNIIQNHYSKKNRIFENRSFNIYTNDAFMSGYLLDIEENKIRV